MNQKERLDYLVEAFKEDSVQYRDLETPRDDAGKRRILRSLMNIRMPGKMMPAALAVQDALREETPPVPGRLRGILLRRERALSPEEIPAGAEDGMRLSAAETGSVFQFLRMGYFCKDKDSTAEKSVYNRVVSLKDSYKPQK